MFIFHIFEHPHLCSSCLDKTIAHNELFSLDSMPGCVFLDVSDRHSQGLDKRMCVLAAECSVRTNSLTSPVLPLLLLDQYLHILTHFHQGFSQSNKCGTPARTDTHREYISKLNKCPISMGFQNKYLRAHTGSEFQNSHTHACYHVLKGQRLPLFVC